MYNKNISKNTTTAPKPFLGVDPRFLPRRKLHSKPVFADCVRRRRMESYKFRHGCTRCGKRVIRWT
jgi:hypothetical protein